MEQNVTNNHKHHKCLQQTALLSNSSSDIFALCHIRMLEVGEVGTSVYSLVHSTDTSHSYPSALLCCRFVCNALKVEIRESIYRWC